MNKLTRTQRDALLALYLNQTPRCGWETLGALVAYGLAEGDVFDADYLSLTESGRTCARTEAATQDKARNARNARARASNGIRRSVGLTRTRNGSWE